MSLMLFAGCRSKPQQLDHGSVSSAPSLLEQERMKLKNAAFCTCLSKSNPKMDSVMVEDGSTAGYLETSGYSIDAFGVVFEAAAKFAEKHYPSKYNKDLTVMKCLDFYNSIELDKLIRELDSELGDEYKK